MTNDNYSHIEDIIDAYLIEWLPFPDDPANIFTRQCIIDRIKKRVFYECESVILREFRYFNNNSLSSINEAYPVFSELSKYLRTFFYKGYKGYRLIDSTKVKKDLNIDIDFKEVSSMFKKEKVETFIEGLDNWIWLDMDFGGKAWSKICNHYLEIRNSKNEKDFFCRLDRLFDFVHNTGNIMTSFRGGIDGWLEAILELKQSTLNPFDLFSFASPDLRRICSDPNIRLFLLDFRKYTLPHQDKSFEIMVLNRYKNIKCYTEAVEFLRGIPFVYYNLRKGKNQLTLFDKDCLGILRQFIFAKNLRVGERAYGLPHHLLLTENDLRDIVDSKK